VEIAKTGVFPSLNGLSPTTPIKRTMRPHAQGMIGFFSWTPMKNSAVNCATPCWGGSRANRNSQFTKWRASPGILARGSIIRDGIRIFSEGFTGETRQAFPE